MTQEHFDIALEYAKHMQECIFLGLVTLKQGCNLIVDYTTKLRGIATFTELDRVLASVGLPLISLAENSEIYDTNF